MGAGEFEMARQHLSKAIAERPEFEDAAINLSLVLCELGDTAEALRCLRPILRKNPESARIHFFYGTVQYHAGDHKEAIQKFTKAMSFDPMDPRPVIGLGELYIKQQAYDKAEKLLKEVLIQQPASVPALFLLGLSLARQAIQNVSKAQEAQSVLDTVLEKSPEHLEAVCVKAALQSQLVTIEAMHRAYEKALEQFQDTIPQACIWMMWAISLEGIHREEWQVPDLERLEHEHKIEVRAELKDMSLGLQKKSRQVYPEVDNYLAKHWL
jgi:tetratricopeptide (TPR) repeat protein